MDSRDQFALDAAGLGARKALVQDAAGTGTALFVEVSTDEMLDVWAAARAVVDQTGRWPVLCERDDNESLFSRFYFDEGAHGADSDPATVLARAEAIDVDARLAELRARRPEGNQSEVERSVTLARYGDAPPIDEIRAAVTGAGSAELAVDRYLFDWERTREPLRQPDLGLQDWFGDWFASVDDMMLVLLPTPEPWAVYAYIQSLDDASWYGQDLLVAAARRWYERYGAEPVASLGYCATWLAVSRPPTDLDDAWRLAAEHYELAENTFSSPGIPVREHAHLLSNLDRWALFSRP